MKKKKNKSQHLTLIISIFNDNDKKFSNPNTKTNMYLLSHTYKQIDRILWMCTLYLLNEKGQRQCP